MGYNIYDNKIRKGYEPVLFPDPVTLEPPYVDIYQDKNTRKFLPDHYDRKRGRTHYLKVWPSAEEKINLATSMNLFKSFAGLNEPVSFEIIGQGGKIFLQFVSSARDMSLIRDAASTKYSHAFIEEVLEDPLDVYYQNQKKNESKTEFHFLDYYATAPYYLPAISLEGLLSDPLEPLYTILSDLHLGELCFYQILFIPTRHDWQKNIRAVLGRMQETRHANRHEQKIIQEGINKKIGQGESLFAVSLRAGIFASPGRAKGLLQRLHSAVNSLGSQRQPLRYFTRSDYYDHGITKKDHLYIFLNRVSLRCGMILNATELTHLCHIPSSETLTRYPKISRTQKSYPVPQHLTSSGERIGYNEHKGVRQDVKISEKLQNRHVFIVGKSGCGKSTLIQNMVKSHLEKGDGFGVIDPHGKLIREMILPLIPKERIEDVIYFNAGDFEHPIGFNILAHSGNKSEKEHIRVDLLDFFEELTETKLGVTIEHLLNFSLAVLLRRHDSTLADIERLLTDKVFRASLLKDVTDDRLLQFWEREFPPLERRGALHTITNKLSPLLLPDSAVRPMLIQKKNAVNFLEIMNQKKIFLANLSLGDIGQRNSDLLGRLLVSKIQIAGMMREGRGTFPDWYLYIDEFQHMATPTMKEILSGARKYRLHLTLATQDMGGIPDDLLRTVFNASTLMFFNCDLPKDQQFIERVLGGKFTSEEIGRLTKGNAFVKIEANVFNLTTYPPVKLEGKGFRDEIIASSRQKYAHVLQKEEVVSPMVEVPSFPPSSEGKITTPPIAQKTTARGKEPVTEIREEGLLADEMGFLKFLSDNPAMFVTKVYKSLGLSGYKGDKLKESLIKKGHISQDETREGKMGRLAKILSLTEEGIQALNAKRLSGKGGDVHKQLQLMIKEQSELYGWKAKIEERIPGSLESVDVGLKKGEVSVAIEISSTTKPDQEIQNIRKCLDAGYDYIVCVSSDEKSLALLKTEVKKGFMIKERERIRFYHPSRIKTFLSGIDSDRVVSEKPAVSDIISNQKQLLNTKEAAELLGLSKHTLYEWVIQKKIPYIKVGRLTKFKRKDLDEWLNKRSYGEDRRGIL